MSDMNTDKELSMDELKAVSGAGVDFNEPYSDVEYCEEKMVQAKAKRKVEKGVPGVSTNDLQGGPPRW